MPRELRLLTFRLQQTQPLTPATALIGVLKIAMIAWSHQWPVVVVSADGNHKKRYDTALEAAKALGIPLREFQIILHTKSHKDVSKNLYYWYADEYNFCGDL